MQDGEPQVIVQHPVESDVERRHRLFQLREKWLYIPLMTLGTIAVFVLMILHEAGKLSK